jgi:serine/threonine protein phosphatase 1
VNDIMNDDELFVVGDVHGERMMLETLLQSWRPDRQRLVMLGDLVDRAPDSYGVVHMARKLKGE